MSRLTLEEIELQIGRHEKIDLVIPLRGPLFAQVYRWPCGCSARHDERCAQGQLLWAACREHGKA